MAKVPVLVEVSQKFQHKMNEFAKTLSEGDSIELGNPEVDDLNESFTAHIALVRFYKALKANTVSPELLMLWGDEYRVERGAPRKRTNMSIEERVVKAFPDIAGECIRIAPELRHLYHGKAVNNKMLVYLAVSYVYDLLNQQP